MAGPNYLTKEGAQKLADELRHLLTRQRPRVVQEVAEAAAQGDRSENAEYIYGKRRLREIDRRIRFLTQRLDSAEIVTGQRATAGRVHFGARVVVEDEKGTRREYRLVGPDEAEPAAGKISYLAPLGRALLERKVGDVVTVRRPAGELELEILAIGYD
jgi:transcription elongation factor GreB